MGLLLTVSTLYVPQFIRKRKLEMLFQATADAFQITVPSTRGISFSECLKLYAQITQEQAENTIRQGKESEIQLRLFQNAFRIGHQFKSDFKINTIEEVMQMAALLYKALRIEFNGEPQGDIVIKRCFFSGYYSSQVCRLISSLDAGLLVGLAGGGKLKYSQRITEGAECCRAYLEP